MQKCVPTQKSVFSQTEGKEIEERGSGSEGAELQATLYKGTRNKLLRSNGQYMYHVKGKGKGVP